MKDSEYRIMVQMHMLDRATHKEFEKLQMQYVNDRTVATHGWMIGYLYDHREEEIYQKDLERKFQMAPSTMTMILQSMQAVGYIERIPVAHDARLKRIAVTEAGEAFHKHALENLKILEKRMVENIPPEDMETFRRVYDRMIANLSEEI